METTLIMLLYSTPKDFSNKEKKTFSGNCTIRSTRLQRVKHPCTYDPGMELSPRGFVARIPLPSWFRVSLGKDHPKHNVHGLGLSAKSRK